jgi:hypothetical protein
LNSHGSRRPPLYNGTVDRYIVKWLAAAAALFAAIFAIAPASAQSGTNFTIPVQNAPVLRLQMRSGSVTIRTWDRTEVQIESSDPVDARHFGPDAVARALRGGDIPIFSTTVQTPDGALILPPEAFSVGSLANTSHDGVVVFGGDNGAELTLTVPNSTALIVAMVGRGRIHMQDYRSGAFVLLLHNGLLALDNVSGDGYIEVARGPIVVQNSAFNRIRARSAIGDILFENCNARQIEVSSVNGSIAYDNGTFVPGLARFETQAGNVALGIAGGGVQIGAHSASGRIYSDFSRGADVRGNSTDTQAIVSGGGPVVTASSQRGGVYLYDGAFKARPQLQQRWEPVNRLVRKPHRPGGRRRNP